MSTNIVTQIVRKLRSPDNKQVLQAVEELRAHGWLEDEALEGADLRYSHLQGADLYGANLQGADLRRAHLQLVNLTKANLKGARLTCANLYSADFSSTRLDGANLFKANLQAARNLSDIQLANVKSLWGAIMPDGSLYDGRFSLEGDLEFARAGNIDTEDPVAMESFYKASEEHYDFQRKERDTPISSHSTVQLIRKLRNSDNATVLHAVDELRARGNLVDGSLEWVYLRYVNLQGADLSGADLHRADLNMAHLQGSDLSGANLQETRLNKANLRGALLAGANLQGAFLTKANLHAVLDVTIEQLAKASRLRGAIMPDGSRYDGRFNLVGDLADARFIHVNTNDADAIAEFYGVSIEAYERGQSWVEEHLPIVWSDVFARRSDVGLKCDLESLVDLDSQLSE